jgi:hypothetical protein
MTHDFGRDEKRKSSDAAGGAPLMDSSPEF